MPASQAELEAILHGAAVAPLSAVGYESLARGFLRITGSDATRWLNGMVTNSIQSLEPGEGNYNFLLNAQGRIQGDCMIYREPGEGEPTFLLATDRSQLETVQQTLDRFIIMDDVELMPVHGLSGILVSGPQALPIVMALGTANQKAVSCPTGSATPLPQTINLKQTSYGGSPVSLVMAQSPIVPAFEIWAAPSTVVDIRTELDSTSALPISADTLDAFRIYSGTPRYGTDIRNSETARDLPQETNQTHALHFAKGCYLGQEIVERIRSRGQVHKLFTRFRLEGDLPTQLPAPLTVDGKPAGELTSAALVPLTEGPLFYALGYARREFLELKKTFAYPGGTATAAPASQPDDAKN